MHGREHDEQQLRTAIATHPARLVSVRGAPGVGTSTLVGASLRTLETPVLAVDLRGARARTDVVAAIATAAEVPAQSDDPHLLLARVVGALEGRGAVLWLDHVDAAAAAVKDLVAELIDEVDDLVIVTSGWRSLGLHGAWVQVVDPLSLPAAVALLRARITEEAGRASDVGVDDVGLALLASGVGCVPLGLEVVASRAALLGIAAALQQTTPSPSLEEAAAHSLRAAWELLPPAAQQALCHLTPLQAEVGVDVAVALIGGDAALAELQRLVEHSLVHTAQSSEGARFRLLPLVREFVEVEARCVGLFDAARQRHCQWFARTAPKEPHHKTTWQANVSARDDRLAAWRWAVVHDVDSAVQLAHALEPLLMTQGPPDLLREVLTQTLAAVAPDPSAPLSPAAVEQSLALGRFGAVRGQHRAAALQFTRCLQDARAANDDARVGFAAACLSYSQRFLGQLHEARAHADEALAVGLARGDQRLVSFAEQGVGGTALQAGDLDEAEAACRRSLAAARRAETPRSIAIAWGNLGLAARARGDLDRQAECLQQARSIFTSLGERFLLVRVGVDEASVAAGQRRPDAEALLRAGLENALVQGCTHSELVARACLVELALAGGDLDAAALELWDFEAAARVVDDVHWLPQVAAFAAQLATTTAPPPLLRLTRDGRTVHLGQRQLDFSRRGPLRLVLLALVRLRLEQPGRGLTAAEVLDAGWPGEKMRADSGAARVYMAVRRLRALGFAGHVVTDASGYALDRRVVVEWL